MGRKAIAALGMAAASLTRSGFARRGRARRCSADRLPGARREHGRPHELRAGDVDLFVPSGPAPSSWRVAVPLEQKYHAAIIFHRAKGQGRITRFEGLEAFKAK